MIRTLKTGFAVALLGLMAGCATMPPAPPPAVVRLQNNLDQLHADPRIAPNAPQELANADAAVQVLASNARRMDSNVYEHRVYVAQRLIDTAQAAGLARYAESRGKTLGAERDRLLVESRTRQLREAHAATSQALATADMERRNAQLAQDEANAVRTENASLRADLADLQARQTQQGYVITLGDVLFEVDQAELKPGSARVMDKLARALMDDPNSSVEIDGHTDSTGSREHNLDLSLRRAMSVKNYLVAHGVDAGRITTKGLGPDYPVASNATPAGRQQNRRVEVTVNTLVAR
ncbi:MAG TPA: OmpA family protein [Rudaea sp.]|nr:OmpA family protein [Rudaea sp.]